MKEDIRYYLDKVNADELKKFGSKVGAKRASRKADVIEEILKVYNDDFIEISYKLLNEYEKALVDNFVQQKCNPTERSVEEIEEKYKNKYKLTNNYYIFFLPKYYKGYFMPSEFYNKLIDYVPEREMKFDFGILDENEIEFKVENFNAINTIDYIIKYLNSKKIKPTAKNRTLMKKDVIKIVEELNIDEVIWSEDKTIENIKSVEDTSIMYSLISILINSHIIDETKEYFTMGINCNKYVTLNKIDKIKMLLDYYINADFINEVERIKTAIIKTEKYPDLTYARNYLISVIKRFPVDKWVDNNSIVLNIRMDNYNYVRCNLSVCSRRDDYYNAYFYEPTFNELEGSFLDIFLLFMASLGIVDIAGDVAWAGDYASRLSVFISNVKLNNFGAMVLGLKKEDVTEEKDTGFMIDDKLNIIIPKGSRQMEYELYFERFLEKNNNKYILDFKGIAHAIDLGISFQEIVDYIEENATVSDNVKSVLKIWNDNLDKVKIRTVNIIEFPKEMEKYFTKKEIRSNLESTDNSYLIVKNNKINNLKKELENKEVYCNIKEVK